MSHAGVRDLPELLGHPLIELTDAEWREFCQDWPLKNQTRAIESYLAIRRVRDAVGLEAFDVYCRQVLGVTKRHAERCIAFAEILQEARQRTVPLN